MANFVRKLLIKFPVYQIPRNLSTSSSVLRKFAYRDFVGESFDNDGGTFINRLVKYLAIENCDSRPMVKETIRYADYYPVYDVRMFRNQLRSTTSDQLPKLLAFTYTYRNNADQNKFVDIINEIDTEITNRIKDLDTKTIISILYGLIFLIPQRVVQTDFYENCVFRLVNQFDDDLPKNIFVEACFYLGLWKKNQKSTDLMDGFIKKHLDQYLEQLTITDMVIISNAAYRVSLKIDHDIFLDRLISGILDAKDFDVPNFVSMIKSVRHNRVKSNELQRRIVKLVKSNRIDEFDFRALVHVFTYFADNLIKNDEITEILISRCFKKLETEFDFNTKHNWFHRPKDLSTFLWSCAFLNASDHIADEYYELIDKIIRHNCDNSLYERNQDELVDALLSLWMLGERFVQYLPKVKQSNMQDKNRIKLDSRINLLFTLAEIETPTIFKSKISSNVFNDSIPAPEYLIKNRPKLQKVCQMLQKNQEKFNIKNLTLVSQIKHLNVAGILVEIKGREQKFHVDVFDETNTLSDGQTPNGILELKLRLLEHYNCEMVRVAFDVCEEVDLVRVFAEQLSAADDFLGSSSSCSDDEMSETKTEVEKKVLAEKIVSV